MKIFLTTFALLATLCLSACNTVEGFGRDMQQGGKSIEHAAENK